MINHQPSSIKASIDKMVACPQTVHTMGSAPTYNSSALSSPHQIYTNHLRPFGTPLPIIDPTQIIRVCVQNTQHDFKLFDDGISLPIIIENLLNIGANMFVPISPKINWKNPSNFLQTKQIFRPHFPHLHISAVSSDIGNDPLYRKSSLIGGSAILIFGLWSSKISTSPQDESGLGTFTITTIQGKKNKNISFISAYIAVNKGSNIGTKSSYA